MTRTETLDLHVPLLVPRTRLYHLAPIGVGTPTVEGLTGYVMRLAEAHCVATSALAMHELLPLLQPQGLGDKSAATWLVNDGSHFNGTADLAREAVMALTLLTGRRDLVFLTLRPWAEVLAPHGLLRLRKQARAWCSLCYGTMLEQGRPLYEPLLWSIAVVTVCPEHRVKLSERCPYADCARALPAIAEQARPGHCSWCKRVLVRREDGPLRPPESSEEGGWDLWVAQQLGTLLATPPTLHAMPTQDAGLAALEVFIRARCGSGPGAPSQFARLVGLHVNLLCRWRKARALPTIDLLLRVCHYLGVSLVEFLLGETSGLRGTTCPVVGEAPRRKPRQSPAIHDADGLRAGSMALLADTASAPLSVAETARRLGCTSAVLLRVCPDAYRLIADRYQAYRAQQREERLQQLATDMRQVMLQFASAGLYPASKRVRARLQRRVHPRNSDYNRIRRQLLPEFGWNSNEMRVARDLPVQRDRICSSSLH